jgi:hypothetical protein
MILQKKLKKINKSDDINELYGNILLAKKYYELFE